MSVDKREAALNISMPFTLTLFQILRVRQYRICSIFNQSVHNIRFILLLYFLLSVLVLRHFLYF